MKWIGSVIFLFSQLIVSAQDEIDTSKYLTQPERFEFTIEDQNVWHYVVNGRENGLMVAEETNVRNDGGYGWTLTALDRNLSQVWQKLLIVPFEYRFIGWAASDGYYYLLFRTTTYSGKDFMMYQIAMEDGGLDEIQLTSAFRVELTEFEVLNRTAIMGGMTDFKPVVITFDLRENPTPRVVPGIFGNDAELLDIKLDRQSGLFSAITEVKTKKKYRTIHVRTFTTDNQLVQQNFVEPADSEYSLITGATTDFLGGFQYVAGTYAARNSSYSKGLYLAKFVGGQQKFIRYINFADLENFWGYLPNKKEQRIRRKVQRKEEKGKDHKFTYRILIHDMVQLDNQYILIGEAYYRRYINEQLNHYEMMDVTRAQTVVKHEYTHAIVVGFDQNGKVLWDHSFDLEEISTDILDEFVTVNVLDDRLELLYLDENLIKSKIVYKEEILEGRSFTPIRLKNDTDELKSKNPEYEELENWYGETLMAYGIQRIKDTDASEGRRKVFYINKLQYKIDESSN
jgi:hypothetical protein